MKAPSPRGFVLYVRDLVQEEGTGRALRAYLLIDRFGPGGDGFVVARELATEFRTVAAANAWLREYGAAWSGRWVIESIETGQEVRAA